MQQFARLVFMTALSLGAVAAAWSAPIPRALSEVESAAEDAIDFAAAGKLERAAAKATYLETEWKTYRKHAERDSISLDLLEPVGHAVRNLMKPETLHDPLEIQLAANEISRYLPQLYAPYAPTAPVELLALDYLGRAVVLDAKQKTVDPAVGHLAQIQQTWTEGLKPKVLAKKGGESIAARYDAEVGKLQAALEQKNLDAASKSASRSLELIDGMERLFPEPVTVTKP